MNNQDKDEEDKDDEEIFENVKILVKTIENNMIELEKYLKALNSR